MASACQRFCCSDFVTIQDEPHDGASDLQNAISTVFRASNFTGDFDYHVLEGPLRLATRLLESPPMIPFINTLFDPDIRDENDKPISWSDIQVKREKDLDAQLILEMSAKRGQDRIDGKRKATASSILDNFADMVRFEIKPMQLGDDWTASTFYLDVPKDKKLRKIFPHGTESRIVLNKELYDRIASTPWKKHKLRSSTAADAVKPSEHLIAKMEFIVNLMHELGHALCNAACGTLKPLEPFYHDKTYSEMGFVVEDLLFGGQLKFSTCKAGFEPCHVGRKRPNKRICKLTEMPSIVTERDYKESNDAYGTRGEPTRPFDVIWRVPMSYFQALFTLTFWQAVHKTNSADDIKAPRPAAWVFLPNSDLCLTPIEPNDAEAPKGARKKLKVVLGKATEDDSEEELDASTEYDSDLAM